MAPIKSDNNRLTPSRVRVALRKARCQVVRERRAGIDTRGAAARVAVATGMESPRSSHIVGHRISPIHANRSAGAHRQAPARGVRAVLVRCSWSSLRLPAPEGTPHTVQYPCVLVPIQFDTIHSVRPSVRLSKPSVHCTRATDTLAGSPHQTSLRIFRTHVRSCEKGYSKPLHDLLQRHLLGSATCSAPRAAPSCLRTTKSGMRRRQSSISCSMSVSASHLCWSWSK